MSMLGKIAAALLAGALAGTPAWAKTLVFCSEGSPEALNPQFVTTTTAMNATRPMFNNLVQFIPGSTQIAPALAERWTISDDGAVYTFTLRAGVKFHANRHFTPTRALNADDVVFSLRRQWKADHPYHAVSDGAFEYFKDMGLPDVLKDIERLDERTVRITLTRPEAPFLANLAMAFAVVQSAEYADMLMKAGASDLFDREPIGTGPFVFASYTKDVTLRYEAFADYWGGKRPIDTLIFSITPNPVVRLAKLKSGECQVAAFPNPGDAGEIAANPALQLLQQEGLNVGYLAMNVLRKPFDDPRVRRALNLAIDKKSIVEAAYQGAGRVAKAPLPPTVWGADPALPDDRYDPVAALRLLAEAGYARGFDTELWYMPVSRPYNPNAKRVGEMIQADLARLGIRVELKTEDWNAYRARVHAGDHAMALFGWTGDNGDPDNFLHILLGCASARPGGNNIAKWCDADYDALVNRAKQTSDQGERARLYAQAQAVFKAQAPWVPLAHSVVFMALRREVVGFQMDPLGRHVFDDVDLRP